MSVDNEKKNYTAVTHTAILIYIHFSVYYIMTVTFQEEGGSGRVDKVVTDVYAWV